MVSMVEHDGARWPAPSGSLNLSHDSSMVDEPAVSDDAGFPATALSDPGHCTTQHGCEGADSGPQPSRAANAEDCSLRAQPLPELVSSDVHEVTARRMRRRIGKARVRGGVADDEEDGVVGDADNSTDGRARRKSIPSARAQLHTDDLADGEDERTGSRRSSLRGVKRHDYR